ncbi:hypothetical protein J4H86_12540 [Spiractinospora alimapuensis]|nr:hypothetical protein J4H86_12540 [Spiractinospora alimapuensis]
MVDWLAIAVNTISVLLAAWFVFSAFRKQPMNLPHIIGLGVLEVALVAQLVTAIVLLAGGDRPAELAVFISYLVSIVLIPPAAALWGLIERGKWGTGVIAAACLVIPAMMVRLQDLWAVGVG